MKGEPNLEKVLKGWGEPKKVSVNLWRVTLGDTHTYKNF